MGASHLMCPDPTKGKFILNSQLNFTSTPLSLMPPTPDASTTMTGYNLLLPCAYRVMIFSDDLWCDVTCCHDPLMSPPSRDYRCQDPGPRTHLSLSPVYPPTHSLSTDAKAGGVVWTSYPVSSRERSVYWALYSGQHQPNIYILFEQYSAVSLFSCCRGARQQEKFFLLKRQWNKNT